MAEAAKGVGRPKVGGLFELVDQDGRAFTEAGMRGRFSLVSWVGGCNDGEGYGEGGEEGKRKRGGCETLRD